MFRELGVTVVTVESLPDCFVVLERSFSTDDKVSLLQGACGETEHISTIRRSSLNPQNSTLSGEFAESLGADVEWEEMGHIIVTTFDKLIAQHGAPAFCKIDTEGYEFAVLSGLSQPIAALSFEFHANVLATLEKCLNRLGELGYERFNYLIEPHERFVAPNWLSTEDLRRELGQCDPEVSGNVFARLS